MALKKNRLRNLFFLVLFFSGCGGGGGSPSSTSTTPLVVNNINENMVTGQRYTPKEIFETPEYKRQWGLDLINASSAYSLGGTGKGIVVGVVDEALDWGHHEFLKEDILHPDSILTYSGNREPSPLEKFHGTATSAIIAARKDDIAIPKNMHGIAFDAQILFVSVELGSPPSDGEYQPIEIEKFDWTAYDAQEALFYKDIASKTDVVNNSFGFTGQITDYSEEVIKNTFPKFIKSLSDEQDTIFVWSAGNFNGILDKEGAAVSASNPGILAGLGYYFPELSTNNVAVVAVDLNGKIADFSNRCGVAKEFCLAAPGVSVPLAIPNNLFASLSENEKSMFSESVLDYLEEHPNEAYLSGSGTSFAAPHVTGALAVLFDLFEGNLSNTQVLQRLYDTANKDGEYSNQEVYGQGLLDLGAASSPVGLPLFYTDRTIYGETIALGNSYISTGKSFGDGLEVALRDKRISFFDALGSPFFIKASNFISKKIPLSLNSKRIFNFNKNKYKSSFNGLITESSWQSILNSEGLFGYRLHDAKINYSNDNTNYFLSYGVNPSISFLDNKSFQLTRRAFADDEAFLVPWTKDSEEGFSIGFSQKIDSQVVQINFFSGSRRSDDWFLRPTFLLEHDGKTHGASVSIRHDESTKYQENLIFGFMNYKDGFLDNNFKGAFADLNGGMSFYSAYNLSANLKNEWKFVSTVSLARVNNISSNYFVRNVSGVVESNFDVGIFKENFFTKNDILSFRLKQEPRIEKAEITLKLPTGRTPSGEINFYEAKFPVLPSGREIFFEALWSYEENSIKTSFSATIIKDKGNLKQKDLDIDLLIVARKFF